MCFALHVYIIGDYLPTSFVHFDQEIRGIIVCNNNTGPQTCLGSNLQVVWALWRIWAYIFLLHWVYCILYIPLYNVHRMQNLLQIRIRISTAQKALFRTVYIVRLFFEYTQQGCLDWSKSSLANCLSKIFRLCLPVPTNSINNLSDRH